MARNVALVAAEHTGLDDDERLASILALLQAGATEVPDLTAVNAVVEDLDNTAFDARDRVDDGTGTEDDYERAFTRARDVTALVAAFADDPVEAVEALS